MQQSNKIRVAVLYGGRSAEHQVSLQSAANVIRYLDPSLFEIIPIGIDKQGNWHLGKDVYIKSLEHNKVHQLQESAWFAPEWIGKPAENQPIKDLIIKKPGILFDVVFPVVHGTLCEDGTLQGLLELADVPYVGCGVLSSAIGMDKDISKRLALHAGISVAPYMIIKQDQWEIEPAKCITQIKGKFSYPVFIKPANTGSSIGITKVKQENELRAALDEAFRFDTKILVEKALNVLELEVAVLESLELNTDPIVSVVGEVKPQHEFYSYEAKYIDENGALLFVPARIPTEIETQARLMAKTLFSTLGCEGMARVDLFLDKDTQQLCFNEVNTIPGFTQISMYPKLMNASGMAYPQLLSHLIQLALKRHKRKGQLIRSYAE